MGYDGKMQKNGQKPILVSKLKRLIKYINVEDKIPNVIDENKNLIL